MRVTALGARACGLAALFFCVCSTAASADVPPLVHPGSALGTIVGRPGVTHPALNVGTFRVAAEDGELLIVGGWSMGSMRVRVVYPDRTVVLDATDNLPGHRLGVMLPSDAAGAERIELSASVVRSSGIARLVQPIALADAISYGSWWVALFGFFLALAAVFGVVAIAIRWPSAAWYALLLFGESFVLLPNLGIVRPPPFVNQPLFVILLGLVAFGSVGVGVTFLREPPLRKRTMRVLWAIAAVETLNGILANLSEGFWFPYHIAFSAVVPASLLVVAVRAARRGTPFAWYYVAALAFTILGALAQESLNPLLPFYASALALQALFLAFALALAFREREHERVRLERLATVDGLTGLANRAAFDVELQRAWDRAARAETPLAALMIDVDEFKRYNDANGHLAGDDVLRRVSAQIGALVTRRDDLAARYGGEEFVVLLPATDAPGARRIAERIREAISALAIPNRTAAGRVTVSVGVASLVADMSRPPEELIARADAALYSAKQNGRDRVESDEFTSTMLA